MGYLAPAGTTIRVADFAGGLARGVAAESASRSLRDAIERRSGLPHCWPVSSGRAAMTLILETMRAHANDSARDEVLIPAYTCYSVAASAMRAGLKPRLFDIDPATLAPDPRKLAEADFSRVLAVVSANLYGIPNPLRELETIARERGVYLLDDAAQALGASLGNRPVGAFGDAGLYSFDKGKIICTIQGGAIVARAGGLADALEARLAGLPAPGLFETAIHVAKLGVYTVCLRPGLYGIIHRLPFLGLGRTEFEPRYPITRLAGVQQGVAAELAPRIDAFNDGRRRVAAGLTQALADLPGIELPVITPDAYAVYARFPLRIADERQRARALAALDAAGIGATASYPLALADVPEVSAALPRNSPQTPGARLVAAQIVTLPTHGYCPPDLGERVRAILQNVFANHA